MTTTQNTSPHVRGTASELGHDRDVCAECGTDWPCVGVVMERCARNHLAHGMPCDCGHHEEKVAQDPERR